MSLDRAPCHFELLRDLRVVAALKQQLCDLLFTRPEAN